MTKDATFGWTFVKKPWGHERVLFRAGKFQVKILAVKAGARLSLQRHKEKREVMMLMTGDAALEVCANLPPIPMNPGDMHLIKPGQVHRVAGVAKESMILEMAFGDDTDIVRFEDDYGRVTK